MVMKPLTPVRSAQFKRDIRQAKKQDRNFDKLKIVLELLCQQRPLPKNFLDHALQGKWKDCREVHIETDWLLIYRIEEDELYLVRAGSHSSLFKK